jgi:hypothetical protein
MQKARQMVPHRPDVRRFGGQCESGIFVEQIQILRADLAGTAEDLHGPANDTGTSQEMNQRLAIEVDVKKSTPICEQLHDRIDEALVSDANPNFTFRRLEAQGDAAGGYLPCCNSSWIRQRLC